MTDIFIITTGMGMTTVITTTILGTITTMITG